MWRERVNQRLAQCPNVPVRWIESNRLSESLNELIWIQLAT